MADAENNAGFGTEWAARLAVALLVVFGAVAAFTFHDRTHRHDLEHVDEPTAVGDRLLVKMPADLGSSLGTFQGKPLTGAQRVKGRDANMRKAGMDDAHLFNVYRTDDPQESGALFLKLAPDDYLKIPAR